MIYNEYEGKTIHKMYTTERRYYDEGNDDGDGIILTIKFTDGTTIQCETFDRNNYQSQLIIQRI